MPPPSYYTGADGSQMGLYSGIQHYITHTSESGHWNSDLIPLHDTQYIYRLWKLGACDDSYVGYKNPGTDGYLEWITPHHLAALLQYEITDVALDNVILVLPFLEGLSNCMTHFIAFIVSLKSVLDPSIRVSLICLGIVGGSNRTVNFVLWPDNEPMIWPNAYDMIYFTQMRFDPLPKTKWSLLYDEMLRKQSNQYSNTQQGRHQGFLRL
jgi:hypothetical protein